MKRFSGFAAKSLALVAMVLAVGASTMSAQAPVKRVLVEEGTGSWCGHCPGGATDMLNNIEQHKGKVIGVAIHNGDDMKIPEDADFSPTYLDGFPGLTVNRTRFANYSGTRLAIGAGNISNPVQQELSKAAKVGVSLENVVYNSSSRTVTLDVKADFVTAVSGDIRFNLYIVEDSVKGSGPGYDQQNYRSKNGSMPLPSSPWYNYPAVITGYQHRHVVRAMLGGAWGTSGVIPNPAVKGGSYTKSYTYKIPASYNFKRISLVGLVQMYSANVDNRQILNAVEQGLLETKLPSLIVNGSISSPYIKATNGTKITKTVTFTNPNDKDVDVDIAINADSSNYPDAWNVTVEPQTATIPANGSVEATITMTPDEELEAAKVVVNATPIVTDAIGIPGSATAFALSDKIKYAVIYGLNPFVKAYSDAVMNIMTDNIGSQARIFTYPADKELYEGFIDQFNAVIISITGGFLADAGNNTVSLTYVNGFPIAADPEVNPDYPNIAKYIKSIMDAGKRVFISAPNSLSLNKQPGTINQDATDFFATLGVDLLAAKPNYVLNGSNFTMNQFTINGIAKEIFEGTTGIGNAVQNFNPNLPHSLWTNTMKLQAGSKSIPIFNLGTNTNDIIGVRYEAANKARVIFLTFDMHAIASSVLQQNMMEKAITWLGEGLIEKVKIPVLTSIESIDFDTVNVTKSKEMSVEISNTGDGDLVVTKIELLGDKVFALKGVSLPFTIAAGGKTSVSVVFAPVAEKSYTTFLQITSNNNNEANSNVSITLSGIGKAAVGVFTPAEEATTIIAMTAGPNPSADRSVLSYTVGGTAPQFVELYVVNSLGQRVAELGSQMRTPGTYTANINAANLASGSYRIVAHTAVETVQLPFVVNR